MPHRDVSVGKRNVARRLRTDVTDAERKLWHVLRAHRLERLSFRRQVPIGPYIADFVSRRARLVIEVYGGQHAENTADVRRDAWFTARGYDVLRFWNNDVLGNIEGVAARILDAVTNRTAIAEEDTPLPDPPPQGGRGSTGPSRAPGNES